AGFFALGVAKQSGRPAAVACTSGTAAAHYLPAVIEAHEARVPPIVLTPHPPPGRRAGGAGPTIDQPELYGPPAQWVFPGGAPPRRAPGAVAGARPLASRPPGGAGGGGPGPGPPNLPAAGPAGPRGAAAAGRRGGRAARACPPRGAAGRDRARAGRARRDRR